MGRLTSRKLSLIGAILTFILALGTSSAYADTITRVYNFTSDHCTGGCLTGQTSGGTVTVTDTGAGFLDFFVQLTNGNQFVNTGFDASFGFNLNGITTVDYSNVTANWTIPGGDPQTAGSVHVEGTGFFEFGLESPGTGGSSPAGSTLAFRITATGLDITDIEANALANFFAADIISGTTGFTGAIDVSTPPTTVPDGGSTLSLLGLAVLGLGYLRRRAA